MGRIGNMEGIVGIKPVIKKVSFEKRGYISISLGDGRLLFAPLKLFPSIKTMNKEQRNKYFITDGQIVVWDYCKEVFHIEQFLGRELDYGYKA
jgi:chloramphenicol O-acetyltransferase